MKKIFQNSFWQLAVIYTALVVAIAFGWFWKYSLQFHIFAVIIALLGIFIIGKEDVQEENIFEKTKGKKTHKWLFIGALIFIFLLRVIPYIGNSIPLGYDTGIYKYAIEKGLTEMPNWIITGPAMEPGFLYLMELFKIFFSTEFILTGILILFSLILGLGVYFVTREFSDKKTALIALFLYAFSLIQFKTFWFMYYKNIIAMGLMLFAFFFLKRAENNKKLIWVFVVLGGLIGSIHRPTFYIFGLSYFLYSFINPYRNKEYNKKKMWFNVLIGITILLFASLFYLGRWRESILIMFDPVLQGFVQTGEGAGTFINFFTYQFSILPYLALALIGIFYFIRKKNFNILVIWAIINFSIVYFKFFFFNRFIIHLDIVLIIMASFGFSVLIKNKRKLGSCIMIALILSAGLLAFKESREAKPLINENELNMIKQLQNTEENAFVMTTSSIYGPWLLGYSERKTISPGLFDYDLHNAQEWNTFWTTSDINYIKQFFSDYNQPLYIFIGEKQKDNLKEFANSGCLRVYKEQDNNKIYEYAC